MRKGLCLFLNPKRMSIPRRQLTSYTIVGTQTEVLLVPGENVLIRSNEGVSFIGRVENIESLDSNDNDVKVRVRIFVTPDDVCDEANRWLHGLKELFLTDQYQYFSAQNIERKLNVRSFSNYFKMRKNAGPDDYYCHTEYSVTATGNTAFIPIEDDLRVFCNCRMPLNPDEPMWQCKECGESFHARCIGKTVEELRNWLNLPLCILHNRPDEDSEMNLDDDVEEKDSEMKPADEESVNKPNSSSTDTEPDK